MIGEMMVEEVEVAEKCDWGGDEGGGGGGSGGEV